MYVSNPEQDQSGKNGKPSGEQKRIQEQVFCRIEIVKDSPQQEKADEQSCTPPDRLFLHDESSFFLKLRTPRYAGGALLTVSL